MVPLQLVLPDHGPLHWRNAHARLLCQCRRTVRGQQRVRRVRKLAILVDYLLLGLVDRLGAFCGCLPGAHRKGPHHPRVHLLHTCLGLHLQLHLHEHVGWRRLEDADVGREVQCGHHVWYGLRRRRIGDGPLGQLHYEVLQGERLPACRHKEVLRRDGVFLFHDHEPCLLPECRWHAPPLRCDRPVFGCGQGPHHHHHHRPDPLFRGLVGLGFHG
mmetsp:Transcript_20594/g.42337  ORF Transcript_20594/g.42337 Transcript_20594/m.42337 type:complete len:215 (+) Transcript_20594:1548-2192(+)